VPTGPSLHDNRAWTQDGTAANRPQHVAPRVARPPGRSSNARRLYSRSKTRSHSEVTISAAVERRSDAADEKPPLFGDKRKDRHGAAPRLSLRREFANAAALDARRLELAASAIAFEVYGQSARPVATIEIRQSQRRCCLWADGAVSSRCPERLPGPLAPADDGSSNDIRLAAWCRGSALHPDRGAWKTARARASAAKRPSAARKGFVSGLPSHSDASARCARSKDRLTRPKSGEGFVGRLAAGPDVRVGRCLCARRHLPGGDSRNSRLDCASVRRGG
jgi:hypothetical protein